MDEQKPIIEKFGDARVLHDKEVRHLPLTTIVRRAPNPNPLSKRSIPITK